MLPMRFNTGAIRAHESRVTFDPPYEHVGSFFRSEVQSPAGARSYIRLVRDVIGRNRPPVECETGNMWTMDIDPEWTTLTNDYGTERQQVRLPTAWLLDALQRYLAFRVSRGADPDV
jgi:hypothetical protein